VNNAYRIDPSERLYAPGRLARTEARFIIAAVEAYCPYDQGKIASVMANPAPGSHEPTHRVAANTHNAVNSGGDLREPPSALDMIDLPAPWQEPWGTGAVQLPHLMDGGVSVAGRRGDDRSDCDAHGTVPASLIGAIPEEVTPPNPPQIPAPPPPTAQWLTPPLPIAAPPPPKQPPPPPQQPPPPPQQVEPPAVGPQPGGAPGSGGGGGGGNGSGSTGGNGGPAEPSPAPSMPPGFVRLAPWDRNRAPMIGAPGDQAHLRQHLSGVARDQGKMPASSEPTFGYLALSFWVNRALANDDRSTAGAREKAIILGKRPESSNEGTDQLTSKPS
jgi:hypothetical protein